MLVLTRQENESITLVHNGRVLGVLQIRQIKGERVRVGIDADKDIVIHRTEVLEAREQETDSASSRARPIRASRPPTTAATTPRNPRRKARRAP